MPQTPTKSYRLSSKTVTQMEALKTYLGIRYDNILIEQAIERMASQLLPEDKGMDNKTFGRILARVVEQARSLYAENDDIDTIEHAVDKTIEGWKVAQASGELEQDWNGSNGSVVVAKVCFTDQEYKEIREAAINLL